MKTCIYLMVCLLGYTISLPAQVQQLPSVQLDYLQQQKDLAIREMLRTGIPASVILAQALLDSKAGQNEVARDLNNHFSIPCGDGWAGAFQTSIAYRQGRSESVCYRVYPSAAASFRDHVNRITDPAKIGRYRMLFKLDVTDYFSWINGLQLTGFIPAGAYAEKLIQIIEDYGLYRYDAIFYTQTGLPERYWSDGDGQSEANQDLAYQQPYFTEERSVPHQPEYGYQTSPTTPLPQYGVTAMRETDRPQHREDYRARGQEYQAPRVKPYTYTPARPVPAVAQVNAVNRSTNYNSYSSYSRTRDVGFDQDQFTTNTSNNYRAVAAYSSTRSVRAAKASQPVKRLLVRKIEHKVGRSDTLQSIARQYGTTVEELIWRNQLQQRAISDGMILRVK